MRPTSVRNQYMILGNNEYVSEDARIKMINKSNKSSFTSWDDRKYYNENVRVVSPVLAENQTSCVTVFKCTCQKYLDEYECVHTVAMSVAKNVLPRSISMHIPLGLKKGPGRPRKAVKGALNRRDKTKSILPDVDDDLQDITNAPSDVPPPKGTELKTVFVS